MIDMKLPVELVTGKNCLADNAEKLSRFGKRFLLVTGGSSAEKSGALSDLKHALASFGGEYIGYDGITQNPLLASCRKAGEIGFGFGASAVIGIGGGSALDAAKAAAVFAADPEIAEDDFYAKKFKKAPLPIILVGTTSGTGSEVTAVSVPTDSRGRKHSISDPALYASLAFGDPSYTSSMGKTLTLTTGIDALAHCVESFLSKKACDESREASIRGIKLLVPALEAVLSDRCDDAVREAAYLGSIYGGLAISYTGTCFPHNVGYYLTETRGIPHGFACAAFMKLFLEWGGDVSPETAARMYTESGTTEDGICALASRCLEYSALKDVKMTVGEIEEALPRWENAGAIKNTPGNFGVAEIRKILNSDFVG